jgi:O-antigen ligase
MNGMLYVYKSMLNKLQNEWRSTIIFILLATMMTALFVSRTLLSVSIIVFVAFSFFHPGTGNQLRKFLSTPLLWGMSLLFVMPLLSGLWSDDKDQWLDILRIKLPLLVMPLAFAAPFNLTRKQWHALAWIFILLITAATAWSMFYYGADMTAVNEAYLKAKTMITPLQNDHVRFSWLVSVAILLTGWMSLQRKSRDGFWQILIIVAVWLIIFLHILAARTGLFSFYIMVAGISGWLLLRKTKMKQAVILLPALLVLPIAAYFLLPSFRNRVKLIRYEFSYAKHTDYLPGSNDVVRVISWKAGWEIVKKNPVSGVGFGDINDHVEKQYAIHYPSMLGHDKILPANEWLIYGSGCGWPGIIVFSAILLIPFFTYTTNKVFWWLLNATAALVFLFDVGLEVQFGVFIYSFVIGWCWKWFSATDAHK